MKVYSRGSVPPPSLWVVRDLQILHKPEGARSCKATSRVRTAPHQGLHLSPLGKKEKKKTYSPDRTGWSCQNDGYHSIWDPAPWRLGGSQLPPFPGLSSLPQGQGEALRARWRRRAKRGHFQRGLRCSQAGKPSFWAHVKMAVVALTPTCPDGV